MGRNRTVYVYYGNLSAQQQNESDGENHMADCDYACAGVWCAFVCIHAKRHRAPRLKAAHEPDYHGDEGEDSPIQGYDRAADKAGPGGGAAGALYAQERLSSGI